MHDDIDIIISDKRWGAPAPWLALLKNAVRTAHKHALQQNVFPVPDAFEVAILLSDDGEVQSLNAHFRGKNKPTNVLSFPEEEDTLLAGQIPSAQTFLGNIIIAFETTTREAHAKSIDLKHHTTHLVIHGFLHLLGYNHMKREETRVMETLEIDILEDLNIKNPYLAEN